MLRIANELVKEQNKNITYRNIEAQDVEKPSTPIMSASQSNEKLSEKEIEDNSNIIKTFVKYCNESNLQEAYNMLTDDCKEQLYKTLDIFKTNYINQIFKGQKSYKLELWTENDNYYTYRITYIDGNPLQTGGYNSNNNYVDYITIVKNDNEFKLNVNQFIKKENLNKEKIDDNFEITVNSRNIYMNYESYNITIKNNTQKTVLINDGKTAKNIYLLDSDDIKYMSLVNELTTGILTINPQYKTTFNLKFNKIYNANIKTENMQINDIYLDKEKYDLNPQDENLEKTNITIDL